MVKRLIRSPLFVVGASLLSSAVSAGTQTSVVTLAQVPAAAQKAIQTQAGERALGSITRVLEGSTLTFDVVTTAKDGSEWNLTVSQDGTLTSAEVPLAETPPAVQKTIKTQVAEGELDSVSRALDGSAVIFRAGMKTKSGEDREFTLAQDGALLSLEVGLADLPPAEQALVTAQLSKGTLESITKTFYRGENSFEVDWTAKSGVEQSCTVSEEGKVTLDVSLDETPPPVRKTALAQSATGRFTSVEKELEGGDTYYDFFVTGPDGLERNFTVASDGTLSSMEVGLAEIPDSARKTVASQVADGKLESIEKVIDGKDITYEVEMTSKAGANGGFVVIDNGNLLNIQVTFQEVARPAQKTIIEKMGNGKILRIDKSFVMTKKVYPFDVEGVKDGQPFDFSVGPGGRFLGRND